MRTERFLVPVGQDLVIRVELRKQAGRLAGFVCQLEADDGAQVVPVVRYDTSHGRLHVHKFWLPDEKAMKDLEDPDDAATDYTAHLDQALEDLVDHHGTYVARMKRAGKGRR